jgi:phytoene synthase
MTATEKPRRVLPVVTLEQSYQIARQRALQALHDYRWAVSNISRNDQRHLFAVLALSVRTAELCNLHIGRPARQHLLDDLREDMRNNFMEEESSDQFPALLDTMRRFEIPQQFLHDIVSAADYCLRHNRFDSFDEWLQFGYRMGGATILAASQVFGIHHREHELPAIACGQAICLTSLLDHAGREIQTLQFFMPADLVGELGVDLAQHNPLQPDPAMLQLVRLLVSRIEKLYWQGGPLIRHLDLDGQRTMKSLISLFWDRLMQIKSDPAQALRVGRSKAEGPPWRFRVLHWMGLEGKSPVLSEGPERGHGH